MKIYKTQQEVEKDIVNGTLTIEGDVTFECNITIDAHIIVNNGNITAWYITARDINAMDINAGGINARDINAGGINALNITARDINALNITARDINAMDIKYYAFCNVYKNIKCKSITAKRDKHQEPFCLDGKLELINITKTICIE